MPGPARVLDTCPVFDALEARKLRNRSRVACWLTFGEYSFVQQPSTPLPRGRVPPSRNNESIGRLWRAVFRGWAHNTPENHRRNYSHAVPRPRQAHKVASFRLTPTYLPLTLTTSRPSRLCQTHGSHQEYSMRARAYHRYSVLLRTKEGVKGHQRRSRWRAFFHTRRDHETNSKGQIKIRRPTRLSHALWRRMPSPETHTPGEHPYGRCARSHRTRNMGVLVHMCTCSGLHKQSRSYRSRPTGIRSTRNLTPCSRGCC